MSLSRFESDGPQLEVRVPWLPVTLWMVPSERDVAAFIDEGVTRGRIWTASELATLLSLGDQTPHAVKAIALAKLQMDGEITEVVKRTGNDSDA
jgi:hypothetical protein